MTREIKFRAWVKNKMLGVETIRLGGHSLFRSWEEGLESPEMWHDDFILMQYTGLNDKDGKEIYESDKLEWEGGDFGTVVWNEELACWLVGNGKVSTETIEWSKSKIVGNIYES